MTRYDNAQRNTYTQGLCYTLRYELHNFFEGQKPKGSCLLPIRNVNARTSECFLDYILLFHGTFQVRTSLKTNIFNLANRIKI